MADPAKATVELAALLQREPQAFRRSVKVPFNTSAAGYYGAINQNWQETTLLYEAICSGNSAALNYILDHGGDPEILGTQPDIQVYPPLAFAVGTGQFEMARSLVAHGASVRQNKLGKPLCLLHAAVEQNDLPMVKLLVANGADLNQMDERGYQPIWYIDPDIRLGRGSFAVPDYILSTGYNVDTPSRERLTMLHCSIQYREAPFVQYLLAHGADPYKAFPAQHARPGLLWAHWPANPWMASTGLTRENFWNDETPTVTGVMYQYYRPFPIWADHLLILLAVAALAARTWYANRKKQLPVEITVEGWQKRFAAAGGGGAGGEATDGPALPDDAAIERYVNDTAAYLRARSWVAVPVLGWLVFALTFLYDPVASLVVRVPIWAALLGLNLFVFSFHLFKHRAMRGFTGIVGAVTATLWAFGYFFFGVQLFRSLGHGGLLVTYLGMAGLSLSLVLLHLRLLILNQRLSRFEGQVSAALAALEAEDLAQADGWDKGGR